SGAGTEKSIEDGSSRATTPGARCRIPAGFARDSTSGVTNSRTQNESAVVKPAPGSLWSSGYGRLATGGSIAKSEERKSMTRRKTATPTNDLQPETPAETFPSERSPPASDTKENSQPKKPEIVFGLASDRTTYIDVAAWGNQFVLDGKVQTRYSCTISRSFCKEVDGKRDWITQEKPSFRAHDLVVLGFLLHSAQEWILKQRLDSGIAF